jgi:hypothetical protein
MARSTRTTLRRASAAGLATTMLIALAGCSGDDGNDDAPAAGDAPSSATPAVPPLPTHTTMGVVSGKLSEQTRSHLKEKVAAVVDDWFDAAYVGGDWPRSDFGNAYPHFSTRAARDAENDAGLMSNERIADRLESVEATKRRLRIDVLAVQQKAVGVTARFVLTMKLTGKVNRAERVAGGLFLTKQDGEWKVFGYDVQRGNA